MSSSTPSSSRSTGTTSKPSHPTHLTIERVPLDALHLDPHNARHHGEENLAAIRNSLTRFGQSEPLVGQAGSGRVIAGNGRLAVMKDLGWTSCDVVFLDVDMPGIGGMRLAERLRPYQLKWMEECLIPEDSSGHIELRNRLPWQTLVNRRHGSLSSWVIRAMPPWVLHLIS